MKQHMLTHKIRDMPQHMFDGPPPPSNSNDEPQPREIPKHDSQPEFQPGPPPPQPPMQQPLPPPQEPLKENSIKREPTETELPLTKRPPSKYRQFVNNTCTYIIITR